MVIYINLYFHDQVGPIPLMVIREIHSSSFRFLTGSLPLMLASVKCLTLLNDTCI